MLKKFYYSLVLGLALGTSFAMASGVDEESVQTASKGKEKMGSVAAPTVPAVEKDIFSSALAAVQQEIDLRGQRFVEKPAGILHLVANETAIFDDKGAEKEKAERRRLIDALKAEAEKTKECAILVKEKSGVVISAVPTASIGSNLCRELIRYANKAEGEVAQRCFLKGCMCREEGRFYYCSKKIEFYGLETIDNAINWFYAEIDRVPSETVVLPFEARKAIALKMQEERIKQALSPWVWSQLLCLQSRSVTEPQTAPGMDKSSFEVIKIFFEAKHKRRLLKHGVLFARTTTFLSDMTKQMARPYSMYGAEAQPYFEAEKKRLAEKEAAQVMADFQNSLKIEAVEPVLQNPQDEAAEEEAFDQLSMLEKIGRLYWVCHDEGVRREHKVIMYGLYKALHILIEEDLIPQLDESFNYKFQEGDRALMGATDMAQALLTYVSVREQKWAIRAGVNDIKVRLGLKHLEVPSVEVALNYYVGLSK